MLLFGYISVVLLWNSHYFVKFEFSFKIFEISRLEEIITAYPFLTAELLTQNMANRLGNVISLLQICALSAEVRPLMISCENFFLKKTIKLT